MILFIFAAYITLMLAIGYWALRKTNDLDDFILGGRSLGPLPSALSAGASDMSGWLLLGLPGFAYIAGLEATWLAAGLLLGTWANWRFMAAPLRQASEEFNNSITLPDYFANRFPELGKALRFCSALLILLFFLFYTSSGLVAGGKLFETVLNVDYQLAVTVGLIAVVCYTLFGGFLAVSWTDVIQSILMLGALLILPMIVLQDIGAGDMLLAIEAKNPQLLNPFTNHQGEALGFIAITSLLAWGLGYFGQPHILSRFKAINSVGNIPKARRIGVTWACLSMIGALLIGWTGIILVENIDDSEKIFIELIYLLTHPAIAGILLAAILAAIMSTADSQLLVASSALSNDLYRSQYKQASTGQLVWIGRIAVIVVAVVAWLLALNPDSSVLDLVSYAWAGFGAAFGPVLLLSLYWRGLTARGALGGMFIGALTVVIWKNLSGGLFDLYEIIPGILLSTATSAGLSLIPQSPSNNKS